MAASTATMRDIVKGGMKRLGLLTLDKEPSGAEAAEYLTRLNGMMHNWRNMGVDITHTTLTLNGTFPLDEKYEEGVKAMLAVSIADENGKDLRPKTVDDAAECWKDLLAQYLDIAEEAEFDPALTNMPSQRLLLGNTA